MNTLVPADYPIITARPSSTHNGKRRTVGQPFAFSFVYHPLSVVNRADKGGIHHRLGHRTLGIFLLRSHWGMGFSSGLEQWTIFISTSNSTAKTSFRLVLFTFYAPAGRWVPLIGRVSLCFDPAFIRITDRASSGHHCIPGKLLV